jgi:magnesium chelatase family protein
MPEFKKNVLEVLRQPMEDGSVTITRSSMTAAYPSRFILVGAMNPCPCGYYGDSLKACRCSAQQIRQYQARISGPLLDRIDIHIEVPHVKYKDITGKYSGESSSSIKSRINEARTIQNKRFVNQPVLCNAQMSEKHLKTFCKLGEESQKLIEMAIDKLGLSARAYTKILKVSRTIADLEKEENIHSHHVAEAIQYRNLDRGFI